MFRLYIVDMSSLLLYIICMWSVCCLYVEGREIDPGADCREHTGLRTSGARLEMHPCPDQASGDTDLREIQLKEMLADILACVFAETNGIAGNGDPQVVLAERADA